MLKARGLFFSLINNVFPKCIGKAVLGPHGGTPALSVPSCLGSAGSKGSRQAPHLWVSTLHSVFSGLDTANTV